MKPTWIEILIVAAIIGLLVLTLLAHRDRYNACEAKGGVYLSKIGACAKKGDVFL